jgi:uroporphyrinogen III methyltransferase / synthase
VRLKGGDPFIFGRGGEEAEALVEKASNSKSCPVSAHLLSAPMYAGIPLTHRDYAASVAIITGHRAGDAEKPVDWVKIANAVDTMVILMGVESLEGIVGKLLAGGISPQKPVAMVESGTLPQQRTLISTLRHRYEEAAEKQIKPPSVILIGEVANIRQETGMVQTTPLKGRVVAITRPNEGKLKKQANLSAANGRRTLLYPRHRNQRLKQPRTHEENSSHELSAGTKWTMLF